MPLIFENQGSLIGPKTKEGLIKGSQFYHCSLIRMLFLFKTTLQPGPCQHTWSPFLHCVIRDLRCFKQADRAGRKGPSCLAGHVFHISKHLPQSWRWAKWCHLKKLPSYSQIKISNQKSLKLLSLMLRIKLVFVEQSRSQNPRLITELCWVSTTSQQSINHDSPRSHKHVTYSSKATRVITAINYGQQWCSSVPIRARAP